VRQRFVGRQNLGAWQNRRDGIKGRFRDNHPVFP